MKNTKLLALALAAVMSASVFAGCGETNNEAVDTAEETVIETVAETEAETMAETVAETEAETVIETKAETVAETEEIAEDVSIVGTFDGTTYTNPYIGISIDFDSSWTLSDAATLQKAYSTAEEFIEDSSMGAYLEGLEQFYDFMATSADSTASINLVYQKYTPETQLLYTTLSTEQIIDTMISTQKDALIEVYTSMGAENITMEKAYTTILGQSCPVLKTVYTVQGVAVYTSQVIIPCDAHSATLTFISYLTDSTDALAAMIY